MGVVLLEPVEDGVALPDAGIDPPAEALASLFGVFRVEVFVPVVLLSAITQDPEAIRVSAEAKVNIFSFWLVIRDLLKVRWQPDAFSMTALL